MQTLLFSRLCHALLVCWGVGTVPAYVQGADTTKDHRGTSAACPAGACPSGAGCPTTHRAGSECSCSHEPKDVSTVPEEGDAAHTDHATETEPNADQCTRHILDELLRRFAGAARACVDNRNGVSEDDADQEEPAGMLGEAVLPIVLEAGPGYWLLQDSPAGDDAIMISYVEDETLIPADAVFLAAEDFLLTAEDIGAPPAEPDLLPLFEPDATGVDIQLGRLQQLYEQFMEQGLVDEALAVAEEMTRLEPRGEISHDFLMQAAVAQRFRELDQLKADAKIHQVGYEPGRDEAEAPVLFHSPAGPTDWELSAARKISCHFQAASLVEVAQFYHHATGMPVRLCPGTGGPTFVHVLCRDQSVRQSLKVVLGSCGWGYYIRDGELIIAPAEDIDRQVENLDGVTEDYWLP